MANDKIEIPKEVVNPQAYKRMIALMRHPILQNTIYVSSEGDEINIAMLPHRLELKIAHLSPKEQDTVREIKRKYNQMRARITTEKAAAFGHSGRNGGRTKEELIKFQERSPFETDIIELLGRMFTITEVVQILGEENGAVVTEKDVKKVFKEHIVEIEKLREEFRNKVTDVRLYNKRPRLEELAWMYGKMKNRFNVNNSSEAYNSMLRTLEQIRKEAEGDILTVNGVVDVNIEAQIQEHIQQEIYKTINLKEIILGRVAARMGYDPAKLIAGLHNSYYAKFVQISGDFEEDAEMVYPSSQAYDFTQIEMKANRNPVPMKQEEPTEEEKSSAFNIKALFLKKIEQQKRQAEARQNLWQGIATDAQIVEDEDEPIDRGRGRAKDKIPPSKKKS